MRNIISESDVEENALSILKGLGYEIIRGDDENYLPGGTFALRSDFKDVVLIERLRAALKRINPTISEEAREQAIKQVLRSESQKLIADNENFHRMLVDGIDVPIQTTSWRSTNLRFKRTMSREDLMSFCSSTEFRC